MAENIKVAREHRRLETNMNIVPVDENLYVKKWEVETSHVIYKTQAT